MTTFRQLALRTIAESGLEMEPADSVLSPEYVFSWLKARYQKAIDSMPFGQSLMATPWMFNTLAPLTDEIASVTYASPLVTMGSSVPLGERTLFRVNGTNVWYTIQTLTGTTLTLDLPYVGETAVGVPCTFVKSLYSIENIRWITAIVMAGYGELDPVHFTKMNELDSYRQLTPSRPRMWIKHGIDTLGRRVVELYPFADHGYRMEVQGYGSLEEPTLDSTPYREIDDEAIVCGGLASAFLYRSQLAAGQNQGEKSLAFMRLADAKTKEFNSYLIQVSNRDSHDQESPRVRVRMTQGQWAFYAPQDDVTTAYEHVWRINR